MPHFCGRTHSARVDRVRLLDDEPAPPPAPAHQQVAELAYSYWEARGRQGGSPQEDWFRAEQELKRRNGRQ